ncbi:MAG TPA: HD domain-containing protein [Desulfobacterales bacterium]|nr:HD domain-containing protein [Desulfobacterales bacterium]
MRKIVKKIANAKSPSEVWLAGIRNYVMSVFRCASDSIHGPRHWQRVEAFGLRLAESTGADQTVVRLFALLHDSCRLNDGDDIFHGPRAAEMLERIVPSVFALDRDRLELLKQAVRYHTSGQTSPDPTIGTCWDADRLDIGRAGITPCAHYMSTDAGKGIAALDDSPFLNAIK